MKTLIYAALLSIGCVDAQTQCASRLGISQDSNNVYISRVSENMRIAYSQCVNEVEAQQAARRQAAMQAISQGLQSAGQSLSAAQHQQLNCSTQCYGGMCFTHCQ